MDKKTKQLIVAGVLFILALLGNKFYLQGEVDQLGPKNRLEVVIAAKGIPAGTRLSEKLIEKKSIPETYLPKSKILWANKADYIGQEVSVDVPVGDYVLGNYFITRGSVGPTLSAQLTGENARAVSLPVDDTNSLSNSVVTGDKIDLIFTFNVPVINQKLSTVLFQNVPVISTGTYSVVEQELGGQGERTKRYNSLTLGMNAQDAFRLNYARQVGQISLLLRNGQDNNPINVSPIKGVVDLLTGTDKAAVEQLISARETATQNEADKIRDQFKEMLKNNPRLGSTNSAAK